MDYARDRGKYITTREAFPHRYYACPTCSAQVFLRRGKKYAAHFAHRSGFGKAECENFHPSDELRKTWATRGTAGDQDESLRPIEPIAVSIELQSESAARRARQWGLRVTVPKADEGRGKFTLDLGHGPKRTIPLSALLLKGETYPADVDAEEFRAVWISADVPANYKEAIAASTRGLDREIINVFATTSQKYKPRIDRLTWGSSYYFVWKPDADIAVHAHLPINPLALRGQWNCIFTTLPDDEDSDLKEWLEDSTGLQIAPQRRTVGIVFPPTCGLDVNGNLLVPQTESMLLGVHLADSDGNEAVKVSDGTSGITFEGKGRHFAEISADKNRKLRLLVGDTLLPPILPFGSNVHVEWPEVRLSFRFEQRSGQATIGLHMAACLGLLRGVRSGECVVAGFEIPSVIEGALQWRSADAVEWQKLVIGASSKGSKTTPSDEELIAKINEILHDCRLEVLLSFGCFGGFHANADRSVEQQPTEAPMPADLRRRLVWILKAAQIYCDKSKRPVDQLDDEHLQSLFRSLEMPPALAAHKRWLTASLDKSQGGQSRD